MAITPHFGGLTRPGMNDNASGASCCKRRQQLRRRPVRSQHLQRGSRQMRELPSFLAGSKVKQSRRQRKLLAPFHFIRSLVAVCRSVQMATRACGTASTVAGSTKPAASTLWIARRSGGHSSPSARRMLRRRRRAVPVSTTICCGPASTLTRRSASSFVKKVSACKASTHGAGCSEDDCRCLSRLTLCRQSCMTTRRTWVRKHFTLRAKSTARSSTGSAMLNRRTF